MTDRVHALTVILEKPIREDDVKAIVNSIQMIKGVLEVKEHITNHDHYTAVAMARMDLISKLWDVLKP